MADMNEQTLEAVELAAIAQLPLAADVPADIEKGLPQGWRANEVQNIPYKYVHSYPSLPSYTVPPTISISTVYYFHLCNTPFCIISSCASYPPILGPTIYLSHCSASHPPVHHILLCIISWLRPYVHHFSAFHNICFHLYPD
jgi:hypothetical protein